MDPNMCQLVGIELEEICAHGAFSCTSRKDIPGAADISKQDGTHLYLSVYENNLYVIKQHTTKAKRFDRTVVKLISALIEVGHHDNITRYFGLAKYPRAIDSKHICYRTASHYYPGGTLSQWVKTNNTSHGFHHDKIRSFLRDLLKGLKFLHSFSASSFTRVVHCDIKPDNLVLKEVRHNPEGAVPVVIIDLDGAAIDGNLQSEIETTCCTPNFASPELLGNTGLKAFQTTPEPVSDKTDIWSVGCVAIQLCTGEEPKIKPCAGVEKSPAPIMYQVAFRKAKPSIPNFGDGEENQRLTNFIASCLEFSTVDRKTAAEMLDDPYFNMHLF